MQHLIHSIGSVISPYTQKFGIPRQPGLVPQADVVIALNPQFTADSIRGLEQFSHIWIQFLFHAAIDEGWSPLVRPPRLGGRQKVGVFASRSPHRPNHIGLSLLVLQRIDSSGRQIRIHCSGADLLHGTPVIDIKPYIPFVEARPQAQGGFAAAPPPQLGIVWQTEIPRSLNETARLLIENSIAQDPRPAYQNDPQRSYHTQIAAHDVRFCVIGQTACITHCQAAQAA